MSPILVTCAYGETAQYSIMLFCVSLSSVNAFRCRGKWYNDRDVRTIVELGRLVGFAPKRDMPINGERHNALADAIHQVRYVSAIYQRSLFP